MKKLIFLCIIFVNLAYSYSYNDILLKAQASIFPKVILLDKKLDTKLIDGKIIYTIVYEESDYSTALEINKLIDKKYKGYFDKYMYEINLVEFSALSNSTKASAIYILNTDNHIKKIIDIASKKGIITFSYDIKNLKKGLLFSLMIEKSTILYLNKENLHLQNIEFVDSLLQMVKFVENSIIKKRSIHNNLSEMPQIYARITSQ